MKKLCVSLFLIISIYMLKAQPSINELVCIHSANTISDMNAITAPLAGSLVFVDNENSIYYRSQSQWVKLGDDWHVIGNSQSNSFIGTTNNQDVKFKTNNQDRMVIKRNGNIGINSPEPTGLFEINSRNIEVDIVPKMTSNSSNGVTLSGPSSNLGTSTTFKDAFDDSNSTNWFVSRTSSTDTNPDAWIVVDLGLGKAVTSYTLRAGSNWNRAPKQYRLQGSTNGTNWVNLEAINTISTNNWITIPQKSHNVTNSTNYRYYRLYFYSSFNAYQVSNYNANYQIDEIQLKADIPELTINSNENVGVNTYNPQEKLHVNGNILASAYQTPDYVFEHYFEKESHINPEYEFQSLEKVHSFIKENHHLPNTPSRKEIEKTGGIIINKAIENNLEKIEELHLHLIELEEYISYLEKKYHKIKKQ